MRTRAYRRPPPRTPRVPLALFFRNPPPPPSASSRLTPSRVLTALHDTRHQPAFSGPYFRPSTGPKTRPTVISAAPAERTKRPSFSSTLLPPFLRGGTKKRRISRDRPLVIGFSRSSFLDFEGKFCFIGI